MEERNPTNAWHPLWYCIKCFNSTALLNEVRAPSTSKVIRYVSHQDVWECWEQSTSPILTFWKQHLQMNTFSKTGSFRFLYLLVPQYLYWTLCFMQLYRSGQQSSLESSTVSFTFSDLPLKLVLRQIYMKQSTPTYAWYGAIDLQPVASLIKMTQNPTPLTQHQTGHSSENKYYIWSKNRQNICSENRSPICVSLPEHHCRSP